MVRAQYRPPDRQNNEPGLDLLEERLEADLNVNPPLSHECGQFQQSDIGDCQAVPILASAFDRSSSFPGDPIPGKRQPDHDMRIDQNQSSSPQSSVESAGETTSPTTLPLPARKL